MAMQTTYCLAIDSRADEYAPKVKFILTPTEYETYVDIAWELEYIADDTYPATSAADDREYTIYIGDSSLTKSFNINNKTGTHSVRSGNKIIKKTNSAQNIEFGVSFNINIQWTNYLDNSVVKIGTISDEDTITIPAKKTIEYCSVTYAKNDGSGENYSSFTVKQGYAGSLSSAIPTRVGHEFKGWTTIEGSNTVEYNPGEPFVVTEDVTFYAIWKELQIYLIGYNPNGGSPTPSSHYKTHGEPIKLTEDVPVREGYIFKGWSTTSQGSVEYSPGSIYTEDKQLILYAIWTEAPYNITYDANGGSFDDGSESIIKKKYKSFKVNIINLKPARENYEFKGWSTTLNGEVEYVANDVYSDNENLTLYAVWEEFSHIKILELYRCDIGGNKISDGTYARLKFEYTAINFLLGNTSVLQWKSTSESNYPYKPAMVHDSCNSGDKITIDTIFGDGQLSSDCSYTILINMYEVGTTYTKELILSANSVFVDFKPPSELGTGGMAIGKSAQLDGILDIGYATKFSGGILHSDIKGNNDFNSFKTPNVYSIVADRKYDNCPIEMDGTLSIEPVGTNDIRQVVTGNSDNPIRYERYYTLSSGNWTAWKVTYNPEVGKFKTGTDTTAKMTAANTFAYGASVTLDKGLYLITVRGTFSASSSSRSITLGVYNGTSRVEEQTVAALKTESRLSISQVYNVGTDGTILQCARKSSIDESATDQGGTRILAFRLV